MREGASENAEETSALLQDLVERGMDPGRRRLFVIDGSKALRKAIDKVFGQRHPIQRCRNHKLRNVLGHLPKDQHPQVKAAFRAAMKLDAKQGEQKLEQLDRWLERDEPSASASLREGLSVMFTINKLEPPAAAEEVHGLDQPDRQHPLARKTENPQGDQLEERSDGLALGMRPRSWRPRRATGGSSATTSSGCSGPISTTMNRLPK